MVPSRCSNRNSKKYIAYRRYNNNAYIHVVATIKMTKLKLNIKFDELTFLV